MTCAFITILYPLTVFQSTAAEIQPDKNQLCTYKVHFVKKRKTSSKLCRRDDANIAVQSLFLNRLIVCSLQLEDISKQTASGGGIFKVSPDCHPSFSPKGFHHFVVTILLFFKKKKNNNKPYFTAFTTGNQFSNQQCSVNQTHPTTYPSVGHKGLLPT